MLLRLSAADAERYRALRLHGLQHSPESFRVALEDEASEPLEDVARRLTEHVVLGFQREGELVATAALSRFSGAKLRHRGLLYGMYVRPEARGTGVADTLVGAILEHARDAGLDRVVLTLVATNERARRLYERHGFVVYGREPGAIRVAPGRDEDELLMSCALRGDARR